MNFSLYGVTANAVNKEKHQTRSRRKRPKKGNENGDESPLCINVLDWIEQCSCTHERKLLTTSEKDMNCTRTN